MAGPQSFAYRLAWRHLNFNRVTSHSKQVHKLNQPTANAASISVKPPSIHPSIQLQYIFFKTISLEACPRHMNRSCIIDVVFHFHTPAQRQLKATSEPPAPPPCVACAQLAKTRQNSLQYDFCLKVLCPTAMHRESSGPRTVLQQTMWWLLVALHIYVISTNRRSHPLLHNLVYIIGDYFFIFNKKFIYI